MAKHIQLTIAEPCHEDWDRMSAAAKGKFCGACQKQVVDFTSMSDTQVAAFFKRPSTGSVCGRFMEDQLDRNIAIPKKRIPWVKYFFQLTLPLFLSSLRSNAQMGKIAVRRADSTAVCDRDIKGEVIRRTPVSDITEIKGKVTDEDGKPLPYASVMIKGTNTGVAADSSGLFTLSVPLVKDKLALSFSSVGFSPAEIEITEKQILAKESLTIPLKKNMLSEVIVVSWPVMGMIRRTVVGSYTTVTGKSIKKITQPLTVTNTPAMRVYPNPVLSGSAININCDKMEESYYSLQLLTLSGQMTLQKELWIDKEARVMNMTIPKVAAGTYLLRMTSRKSGKSFTDKIVIE